MLALCDHVMNSISFLALKEGVVRIVQTFGDKLLAFRFPPRIARKLQSFVDHS
jgi:nucleoporin NDC1